MGIAITTRQFRAGNPPPSVQPAAAQKERCFMLAHHIRKHLLRRSLLSFAPEAQMMIEIIVETWRAASEKSPRKQSGAREFFTSGRADRIGELIGAPIPISTLFRKCHEKGDEARIKNLIFSKRENREQIKSH